MRNLGHTPSVPDLVRHKPPAYGRATLGAKPFRRARFRDSADMDGWEEARKRLPGGPCGSTGHRERKHSKMSE